MEMKIVLGCAFVLVLIAIRRFSKSLSEDKELKKWVRMKERRERITKIHANDLVTVSYECRWLHLEDEGREVWVECASEFRRAENCPDVSDGWNGKLKQRAEDAVTHYTPVGYRPPPSYGYY